jgi:hypothetical protein
LDLCIIIPKRVHTLLDNANITVKIVITLHNFALKTKKHDQNFSDFQNLFPSLCCSFLQFQFFQENIFLLPPKHGGIIFFYAHMVYL